MNIFHVLAWVVQLLFWVGLIPQVVLNARLRSARGMSDLMLFGYVNGYLAYNFYAYGCGLPLAYRVILPLSLTTVLILAGQRLWYNHGAYNKLFMLGIGCSLLCAIALLPIAHMYPLIVGHVAGWIMMSIWATYQIPQVIKIAMARSVAGFSFFLVLLIGLGDTVEFTVGLALGLPIQSVLNNARGIIVVLIFMMQFWLYAKTASQELHA